MTIIIPTTTNGFHSLFSYRVATLITKMITMTTNVPDIRTMMMMLMMISLPFFECVKPFSQSQSFDNTMPTMNMF